MENCYAALEQCAKVVKGHDLGTEGSVMKGDFLICAVWAAGMSGWRPRGKGQFCVEARWGVWGIPNGKFQVDLGVFNYFGHAIV